MDSMCRLAVIAVTGIVFVPAGPAPAQDSRPLGETLGASERAQAVGEIAQGCLEHQRISPENKGVSENRMEAYCRCSAERGWGLGAPSRRARPSAARMVRNPASGTLRVGRPPLMMRGRR
jgi:hypothetical protein